MRRYVATVFLSSILMLMAIALLNWAMDPFLVWGQRGKSGAIAATGALSAYAREFQIIHAFKFPLRIALLGTSRTGVGLDPGHDGLGSGRRFNLAMGAQSVEDSNFLMRRLVEEDAVRTIVWGLDIVVFNCDRPYGRFLYREQVETLNRWRMLVDRIAMEASLRTLLPGNTGPIDPVQFASNGAFVPTLAFLNTFGEHRKLARESDRSYMKLAYASPFTIDCGRSALTGPLSVFRKALQTAYRHRIDLRLFVSPSHARQWETLRTSGIWQKWEQWKRELMRINLAEARAAGANPFPLWDFSGFTELTTEPFPPLGDTTTQMRWYWESSHYKKELGDLVLDRMFDYHHPDRKVPDDFGVQLTPENIEAHLAWIREGRERWAKQFPDDVREIAELARKAGIKR